MADKAQLTTSHIFVDSIVLHAFHGVLPQERLTGNDYRVSVDAEADIERSLQTDNVNDTVDYGAMFNIVKEQMAVPSALVEHVAGRIATALFQRFQKITSLRLRIEKINPPMGANCHSAGIEFLFTRQKTI